MRDVYIPWHTVYSMVNILTILYTHPYKDTNDIKTLSAEMFLSGLATREATRSSTARHYISDVTFRPYKLSALVYSVTRTRA